MAKKRMIFLAIAVLYGFTPWFSLSKQSATGDDLAKLSFHSKNYSVILEKLHYLCDVL